jgi:hypothetical protein
VNNSRGATQIRAFFVSAATIGRARLALSQLLSQSCHMRASGALAGFGAPLVAPADRITKGDILK